MIRHFAGLAEIVDDVDAAVRFYRDLLGLTVERHDEGYATAALPGVMHFGIWDRRRAAESVFGTEEQAEQIPLGFTIELEVDNVEATAGRLSKAGQGVLQGPQTEPWGQKTARLLSPGGGLFGLSETPWARRITSPAPVAEPDRTG